MKPITTTLSIGQKGYDVTNYQEVLMALFNAGLIPYDDLNVVNGLAEEHEKQFFGTNTAILTNQLRALQSIPETPGAPLVNADVIATVNSMLLSLNLKDLTISGRVRHRSGQPLTGSYVTEVYYVTYDNAVWLGSPLVSSDGHYTLELNASTAGIDTGKNFTIGALVKEDGQDDAVYSPEADNVLASAVANAPGGDMQIDLTITSDAVTISSEFTELLAQLEELGIDLTSVDTNDTKSLALLSTQISQPLQRIINMAQAVQLHGQMPGITVPAFYGLLRQNFSADLPSLSVQPGAVIRHALEVAAFNHIIPSMTDADLAAISGDLSLLITAYLTNGLDNGTSTGNAFIRIIYDVLQNESRTKQFVNYYYGYHKAAIDKDFWDYLTTQDAYFIGVKPRLKNAIALAVLTGNNPPLLRAIYSANSAQLDNLTGLLGSYSQSQLIALIQNAKTTENDNDFAFPETVVGINDAAKMEDYANQILARISVAYPTHTVAKAITSDIETPFPNLKVDLGTFVQNNPGFDFRTVPLAQLSAEYDLSGVSNQNTFIEEVAIVQRLSGVTNSYPLMAALAGDGLHSSMQIAQQSEETFVATYQVAAGGAAAAQAAYSQATTNSVYNFMAAMNLYTQLNGQQVYVLDKKSLDPQNAYAEWRTLFGSLDSCNCSQCQSIYSPSAYLTDLLQFLKNNLTDLYHDLNLRRPDIKNIELSCKNTNTPVPHIDIVNELLEDLASAVIHNSGYKLYARQTNNSAATQRAVPEHINTSSYPGVEVKEWDNGMNSAFVLTPYDAIKSATYPWTLPYNLYKRQIDEHLDLAGLKGCELIQFYNGSDDFQIWYRSGYYAKYIGLTDEAFNVITFNYPMYFFIADYYGLKKQGNWVTTLPDPALKGDYISVTPDDWEAKFSDPVPPVLTNRVDVFLQQTGLTYTELLELLDCYTLNPQLSAGERKMAIVKNDHPKATDDTCDLSMLRITGVTVEVLGRLHRFVRLKRALNWTYYELDKALISLNGAMSVGATGPQDYDQIPINHSVVKFLVIIKKIMDLLNIEQPDVLFLGKDIDALPYRDYTGAEPKEIPSEYAQLFRNPQLAKIDSSTYPFAEDPAVTAVNLYEQKSYLAGIFNIAVADLDIILLDSGVANTIVSGDQFMAEASKIFRVVKMMKALRLSAQEWVAYKTWISTSDFNGSNASTNPFYDQPTDIFRDPLETLRFISFVNLSRSTGMSIAQVSYILQDVVQDPIAEANLNTARAKTLTILRDELQKKALPSYDQTNDVDGKVLEGLLQAALDKDSAAKLIDIVQHPVATGFDFAPEDVQFLQENVGFLTNTDRQNLTIGTNNTGYWQTAEDRRACVFEALRRFQRTNVLQPFIANFLSKEIKLGEDLVKTLLSDCIRIDNMPALEVFMQETYLSDHVAIVRWTNQAAAFQALTLLQKAALLVSTFKLGSADLLAIWRDSLLPDVLQLSDLPLKSSPAALPTPTVYFYNWLTFVRWMKINSFIGAEASVLYDMFRQLPANTVDATAIVAPAFKTSLADMNELTGPGGYIGIGNVSDFLQPYVYEHVMDALKLQYHLPAPMATLISIAQAVSGPDSQTSADVVIQAVKAQYDEQQWLSVIRPVNDRLRVERRDALVAFLLTNPPVGYANQWHTSNDIFETLMVDVDMSSCMTTTRVLLAVNTIQLWVDRVLLNLEKGLQLTNDKARQWHTWRKLYRVWEANRKVFIYPENWIEPELRDDKSPFFLELEKFLKQNELTDENVEQAYKTYLERLDEVAHLEVVGMYREENATVQTSYRDFKYASNVVDRDTIHVIGRTTAQPHIHYYRKRVADEWTPWEKIDVQIDSDHLIPVMWRGRLRLYWLTFMKDQGGEAATSVLPSSDFILPPTTRWKINLAWSEYKNGRWSPKQVSKDSLYSYGIEEENLQSIKQLRSYEDGVHRFWYPNGSLEKQRRERLAFYCYKESEDGELRFELEEKVMRTTTAGLLDELDRRNPGSIRTPRAIATDIIARANDPEQHDDVLINRPGHFKVRYNGVLANEHDAARFKDHLYALDITSTAGLDYQKYDLSASRFRFSESAASGYSHYPDSNIKLLNYAPDIKSGKKDDKYIVIPRNLPDGYVDNTPVRMPYFFYADYDNSFFVEKIIVREERAISVFPTSTGKVNAPSSGLSNMPFMPGATNVPVLISNGIAPASNYVDVVKYRFHNFHHATVDDFQQKLHTEGLDGLLDRRFISGLSATDHVLFETTYQPTAAIDAGTGKNHYPDSKVDFRAEHAFSLYNWELFYHIPALIANKLCNDQKFEAARKWYHYIFNPTAGGHPTYGPLGNYLGITTSINDFWNFTEFYNNATNVPSTQDLMNDTALPSAVARWADNPFKPHLVARTRISAYMKNTVMKYLDNLVAWGDSLYRTDTRENINEATLLYVLAAQLLGKQPNNIPARAQPKVQTYASLAAATLNAFSNARVAIENYMLPSGATAIAGNPMTGSQSMMYFCILPNDKLASYWTTVADRLFKIRHCQNIDGVERELALFDPPIDPALLVKAAAAGVSLSDALSGINAPLPNYRFNVMSQKATELTSEVKALGSQLLAALEKKDAESLALLRSSQEASLLNAVTEIKEKSLEDSVAQINSLGQQQKMATMRRDFYQNAITTGLNPNEQLQLDSQQLALTLQYGEIAGLVLAAALNQIPDVTIGAFSAGAEIGGKNTGDSAGKSADAIGITSGINNAVGAMAATKGAWARRKDDWNLQLKLTNTELKQIEQQLLSAQIRKEMAEKELKNHQLQLQHNAEMDTAMREKYTNEALYDWMTGQISVTYFQAYKLAMDMAKRAERCYQYELASTDSFISAGYWDSLRKGLLSGEQLAYDIKRMEVSYLEKNRRQLELTKHISLAALDPVKLAELKARKACDIELPEWLFDMDYPGQHLRRIKSVSISIPCVAGPYTTISCKLSLLKSKYRKTGTIGGAGGYPEQETGDDRFNYQYSSIQSIATSHAQNDSGMFEFSFRDERYLPFEGAGAVGTWRIELPAAYAQFDYDTISDIIIQMNYTAVDEGGLRDTAKAYVQSVAQGSASNGAALSHVFDLKHEFATEWHAFISNGNPLTLGNLKNRLPYLAQVQGVTLANSQPVTLVVERRTGVAANDIQFDLGNQANVTTSPVKIGANDKWWSYHPAYTFDLANDWQISARINALPVQDADIKNMYLILRYSLNS